MNAPHLTALVRTRRRRPRSARCLCGERTIGHIHRIHAASGKTYGARRTHRQLRRKDLAAARHAIERLMCEGRPCAAACCSQLAGAGRAKRCRGWARAWRNHLASEVKPGMACIIARVTSSASLKRGAMTTGGRPGAGPDAPSAGRRPSQRVLSRGVSGLFVTKQSGPPSFSSPQASLGFDRLPWAACPRVCCPNIESSTPYRPKGGSRCRPTSGIRTGISLASRRFACTPPV
ncbi:IS3 family transposase [Streptomyces anulatus]